MTIETRNQRLLCLRRGRRVYRTTKLCCTTKLCRTYRTTELCRPASRVCKRVRFADSVTVQEIPSRHSLGLHRLRDEFASLHAFAEAAWRLGVPAGVGVPAATAFVFDIDFLNRLRLRAPGSVVCTYLARCVKLVSRLDLYLARAGAGPDPHSRLCAYLPVLSEPLLLKRTTAAIKH